MQDRLALERLLECFGRTSHFAVDIWINGRCNLTDGLASQMLVDEMHDARDYSTSKMDL